MASNFFISLVHHDLERIFHKMKHLILLILLLIPQEISWCLTDQEAVRVIIAEGANQGKIGMKAIGEVIRTRGSLKGFSCLKRHDLDAFIQRQGKKVYQDATRAWYLSKTSGLTHKATHYEAVRLYGTPYWAHKMELVAVVKDHYFYR